MNNIFKHFMEGWTLGLSTGIVCLSTCSFIYAPFIANKKRKFLDSLSIILQISIGRFFAYFLFGFVAGYFGGKIDESMKPLYVGISYMLLSIFLIFYSLRQNKTTQCAVKSVNKHFNLSKSPILLGLATGINFCPSFLIALAKSVSLGGALSGGLFFVAFFFGTSIFLIPIAFVGLLTKINNFTKIAQYASIAVAIWFMFQSGQQLRSYYDSVHDNSQNYQIENFCDNSSLYLAYSDLASYKDFKNLKQRFLKRFPNKKISLIKTADLAESSRVNGSQIVALNRDSLKIKNYKNSYIILLDIANESGNSNVQQDSLKSILNNRSFDKFLDYLNYYKFKIEGKKGFIFIYKS